LNTPHIRPPPGTGAKRAAAKHLRAARRPAIAAAP
jgi:hypothetical protein